MRQSWDDYFLEIAKQVATRSTCPRKHVGAVVVIDNRILTTGYNGSLPDGLHCDVVGCDMEGEHCVRTVHAEVNAIAQAARFGIAVRGATMYTTITPCRACEKVVLSAGIKNFIWAEDYP